MPTTDRSMLPALRSQYSLRNLTRSDGSAAGPRQPASSSDFWHTSHNTEPVTADWHGDSAADHDGQLSAVCQSISCVDGATEQNLLASYPALRKHGTNRLGAYRRFTSIRSHDSTMVLPHGVMVVAVCWCADCSGRLVQVDTWNFVWPAKKA